MLVSAIVILALLPLLLVDGKSGFYNSMYEIRNKNGFGENGNYMRCLGTRISYNWLLTGASCVSKTDDVRKITLLIGTNINVKNFKAKQIETFPEMEVQLQLADVESYDTKYLSTFEFYKPNLALLKFDPEDDEHGEVDFENIYLPNSTRKYTDLRLEINNHDGSLKALTISTLDCDPIDVSFICAKPPSNHSLSDTDVGGALWRGMDLIGIFSMSFGGLPIIFTNVAYPKYEKWILSWSDK